MVTVANYEVGCTKSHWLATEANLCEWFAHGCTWQHTGQVSKPRPLDHDYDTLTTGLQSHGDAKGGGKSQRKHAVMDNMRINDKH